MTWEHRNNDAGIIRPMRSESIVYLKKHLYEKDEEKEEEEEVENSQHHNASDELKSFDIRRRPHLYIFTCRAHTCTDVCAPE